MCTSRHARVLKFPKRAPRSPAHDRAAVVAWQDPTAHTGPQTLMGEGKSEGTSEEPFFSLLARSHAVALVAVVTERAISLLHVVLPTVSAVFVVLFRSRRFSAVAKLL